MVAECLQRAQLVTGTNSGSHYDLGDDGLEGRADRAVIDHDHAPSRDRSGERHCPGGRSEHDLPDGAG